MARVKSVFVCQQCGAESPKWVGRCSSCGEWNTFVEEIISKDKNPLTTSNVKAKPVKLQDIERFTVERIQTNTIEFNRIMGGGIVPGSVILLAGEPGIGKSTLALQLLLEYTSLKSLYVSGEESMQQIRLRAERVGMPDGNCFILPETSLETILTEARALKPGIIVVDSIQTLSTGQIESSPGTISQIRECSSHLLRYAKETNTPVILIGHINKEGGIAGPKVLEHIVDVVLQFEGDSKHLYRILRASKNRFGSTSEMGIFEMRHNGLREILNPSEILLSQSEDNLAGTTIASVLEGIRPLLLEVQSLVSTAVYGTPQRSSTGFDLRRLNMLLAVLEKKAGFKLAARDVFLNVAGGIKIADPAADLAIVSAILSSSADVPVNKKICLAGEVGLTGEIRAVSRIDARIIEAEKLGFDKIIFSSYNKPEKKKYNIKIEKVDKIDSLVKKIFA
ncbi:MAG: DNA repair protein RadA [Bacteroidota bacterium]